MERSTRNKLFALGIVWGLVLAAVPALVMADAVDGFVVAAGLCAAAAGVVGTLAAGRRASRRQRRGIAAGIGAGLVQGLVGGAVAALLAWGLMAVAIAGVSPANPGGLSNLMRPAVFTGSFFVALSVFVYALAGGILLGPAFGTLVNRAARKEGTT